MLYIILENRVEEVSSVTTPAVTQPSERSHLAHATQSFSHRNAVTSIPQPSTLNIITPTGDKRLVVWSKCRTFAAPTTQKTLIWTEPKNLS